MLVSTTTPLPATNSPVISVVSTVISVSSHSTPSTAILSSMEPSSLPSVVSTSTSATTTNTTPVAVYIIVSIVVCIILASLVIIVLSVAVYIKKRSNKKGTVAIDSVDVSLSLKFTPAGKANDNSNTAIEDNDSNDFTISNMDDNPAYGTALTNTGNATAVIIQDNLAYASTDIVSNDDNNNNRSTGVYEVVEAPNFESPNPDCQDGDIDDDYI